MDHNATGFWPPISCQCLKMIVMDFYFLGATVESPLLSADNCLICVYKFLAGSFKQGSLMECERLEMFRSGGSDKGCEKMFTG